MQFRNILIVAATACIAQAQSFYDSNDFDLQARDIDTDSEFSNSLFARDVDAILAARGYDFDSELNNYLIARDVEDMLDVEIPSLVRRGGGQSRMSNGDTPPSYRQSQRGDRLPSYRQSQNNQGSPPAYDHHEAGRQAQAANYVSNNRMASWQGNGKSQTGHNRR